MSVRLMATEALDELESVPPAHVYAGGRGVAATNPAKRKGTSYVFRAVNGRVRFEQWEPNYERGLPKVEHHWLPPDLEARARKLLETL